MISPTPSHNDASTPSKADLLKKLLAKRGVAPQTSTLTPRPSDTSAQLSFAQQRLWFLQQMHPESSAYHLFQSWDVQGALCVEKLETAFQTIIQRHEIFRTAFSTDNASTDVDILNEVPFKVGYHDLTHLPDEQQTNTVESLKAETFFSPFSFEEAPLLRVTIAQTEPTCFKLLVCVHHIIFDGWSISLLIDELRTCYEATESRDTLPPLKLQYYDYAYNQKKSLESSALETQRDYWAQQLRDTQPIDFPTDYPRPATLSDNGSIQKFRLPTELLQPLQALARQHDCTLFMVLLAAWQVLIHRYSGSEDICIGSPVAGRPQSEWEPIIGFFTNMLVIRGNLAKDQAFTQYLAQVKQTTQAAYQHQDYPFEVLVEHLQPDRTLSQNPLFQIAFSFQNLPKSDIRFGNLSLEAEAHTESKAKFDLLLALEETDGILHGSLEYSTDLFEATTIETLIKNFEVLLHSIVDNPNQAVSKIKILSDTETQFLSKQSAAQTSQPTQGIHQKFESQALHFPNRIAISFEDTQLTYAELDEQANHLAYHLYQQGVTANTLVGLCLERTPDTIVSILGILKAGGAYLPLDPTYPQDRLRHMIEDSGAKIVLTDASIELPAISNVAFHFLKDIQSAPLPSPSEIESIPPTGPQDLAYVIYTSGSTGKPKGVLIPHENITRLFEQTEHWFHFDHDDVWTLFHSFSFDFSVWEIWGALVYGGRLVLVPYWVSRSTDAFCQLLVDEKVTVLNQTPSAFRQLTQHVSETDSPPTFDLKWVIFGGEALDLPSLKPWLAHYGDQTPKLVNMYGITETTVHVTYREITQQDVDTNLGSVIGCPIPDLSIHILDTHLQPVPRGVVGEIFVGGAGLAQGYLNRPELTAERFIQNPFSKNPHDRLYKTGDLARYLLNGDIEYRGRSDFQVQLKGFRIELGEIQAALLEQPSIAQAVVIASENNSNLIAYLVAKTTNTPSPDSLRQQLAESLPDYMIPTYFVYLPSLPLTANNKLDRQALPTPSEHKQPQKENYIAPTTEAEQVLQTICCEVLGIDRISIQDNLFTLGADSIRTLQIRAKTRQEGYDFELQDAFRYQTIAALASNATHTDTKQSSRPKHLPFALVSPEDQSKLPADVEDAYPLSALQSGMLFHSELNPDSAIYHDIFSYRLRAPYDADKLTETIELIIERHPILRTAFLRNGLSSPLQCVHTTCPAPIEHHDIRHLESSAQKAQLEQWLEHEKARHYEWTQAPLFKLATHKLNDEQWQFSLSLHHSILDGWSVSALLAEIFERYLASLNLHPQPKTEALSSSFVDFIQLERDCIQSEETIEFWRNQLAEVEVLPLPRWPEKRNNPSTHRTVRNLEHTWDADFSKEISQIAQQASAPVKNVLMAAHVKIMAVIGNQSDVLTGLISNGRPEENDAEKVLGLFLNTVPLRIQTDTETWLSLIEKTFSAERALIPHRRFPLSEIQRLTGQRDLCETAFNFVHFHVLDNVLKSPHIELLDTTYFDENNFALFAQFSIDPDSERLNLQIKFDETVFTEVQMERILGYYQRALEAIVNQPQNLHNQWNPLDEDEHALLVNGFKGDTLAHDTSLCLHHPFEQQSINQPNAHAIIWGNQTLTYRELNQRSTQLAHYLHQLGATVESRIGVCLNRTPDLIVSLLAILKTGATYIPLDPAYPSERIAYMLEDAQADILMTETSVNLNSTSQTVFIDTLDFASVPISSTLPSPAPENLAYIIYTSGSTGLPKGTAITHRNAVAMVHWAQSVYSPEETRGMLTSTSVCFDLSVYEIFLTLAQGGTLILANNALELPELPAANQVTLINTVPSAMAELVRSQSIPDSVRTVNLAGEPLKASLSDAIYQLPHIEKVYDLYGPSEDTTYSTYTQRIPQGQETIGRPVANTHLYLLDNHLNPVPLGTAGEIYLSGEGITRGYFAKADLSASRYIPDPFSSTPGTRMYKTGDLARYCPDGNLEFLGRLDHQVKIRGYRIELGEIQTRLEKLEAVKEAIVIAIEDDHQNKKLVAYVVTATSTGTDSSLDTNTLRETLRKELPEYMVPNVYVFLDALPRTPNGKLDRKALPKPDLQSQSNSNKNEAPPRNDIEAQIAQVWQQVLSIQSIGIHDNFFALGGDSILMIQVVSRARELGIHITTRHLFEHETIAELAQVATALPTQSSIDIAPIGDLPLTPIQHWFFEQNFAEPNHWNQSILLKVAKPLDIALVRQTALTLINHHDSLRLSFIDESCNVIAALDSLPEQVVTEVSITSPSDIEAACEEAQSSLDIQSGPIIKFVYLQGDDTDRLFLAIHHLGIDGVSWRILLQDLQTIYEALEAQQKPKLVAPPTSLRSWSHALVEHAKNASALTSDIEYWTSKNNQSQTNIPTDHTAFLNTYSEESITMDSLSKEKTEALLRDVHSAYNTQINDILLAALAITLSEWTGRTAHNIHLEGHGREPFSDSLDISNTLGWFTALYPVELKLAAKDDFGLAIREVKETLRAIPNKGMGYGLLRYLKGEPNLPLHPAPISFNYLGQTESITDANQRFLPSDELRGHDFGPKNIRPHLIDISAIIIHQQLQIDWRYPKGAYSKDTIQQLNQSYIRHLNAIIEHCTAQQSTQYTPSDFSIDDIDQSELDDALDEIEF